MALKGTIRGRAPSLSALDLAGFAESMLRFALVLAVGVVMLAPGARAQLCTDTTAIASVDFSAAPTPVAHSPTWDRITFAVGSTFYKRESDSLSAFGSYGLGGSAVRGPSWGDLSTGDDAMLVATSNGSALRLNGSGTIGKVWDRTLRRSGCASDSLQGDVVPHIRDDATAAFKTAYSTDVLFVATRYSGVGSGCGGDNTDNRVYALNAETGAILWTFNSLGTSDIDIAAGIVLDAANDTLFMTTERTASANQHSVWAIDVLTGTLLWSVNAGRILTAPILHDGRLYVANVAGEVKALDPSDGSESWGLGSLLPYEIDPVLVELSSGETLIVAVDYYRRVRVVRDDGAAGTSIAYIELPGGTLAAGPPIADDTGRALIGGNDGKVYPLDLVAGTVGMPLVIDGATASVEHLTLELPGLFSAQASFLATTTDGRLARFCTTLGVPAAVPTLTTFRRALFCVLLLILGATFLRPRRLTQRG